jgi:hypothetical protein
MPQMIDWDSYNVKLPFVGWLNIHVDKPIVPAYSPVIPAYDRDHEGVTDDQTSKIAHLACAHRRIMDHCVGRGKPGARRNSSRGGEMSRYATPHGLTLSSSPPECRDDPDAINAAEERVEEMARQEILSTDPRFVQWFTEHSDGADHTVALCRHFAACLEGDLIAGWTAQGSIVRDYQDYRIWQELS